jgi:hypothetical protein
MINYLPGSEQDTAAVERLAKIHPDRYFRVGEKANVKDFEYLTHIVDIHDFGDCIESHEHPSICADIPKGAKLKYKGCHWAYMNFRFETDQYDVNPNDVVGNVFIQTIKKRFIIFNAPADTLTMWEQTFYIDKFGNKWRLINEDGTVELIELASKNFLLWNYADKPLVAYENEYDFKYYDLWTRYGGTVKQLY